MRHFSLATADKWWRRRGFAAGTPRPLMLALLMLSVGQLQACDPPPTTIAVADDDITGLAMVGPELQVSVDLGEKTSIIRDTSIIAYSIGQVVKGGAKDLPAGTKSITLEVSAVGVNGYGQKSTELAAELSIPVEDLRKIDYENVSQGRVLNFVNAGKLHPLGQQAAKSYCDDPENAHFAEVFCGEVAAGAFEGES